MLLVISVSIVGHINASNNLFTTADICFDLAAKENSLWFLIVVDTRICRSLHFTPSVEFSQVTLFSVIVGLLGLCLSLWTKFSKKEKRGVGRFGED